MARRARARAKVGESTGRSQELTAHQIENIQAAAESRAVCIPRSHPVRRECQRNGILNATYDSISRANQMGTRYKHRLVNSGRVCNAANTPGTLSEKRPPGQDA